MDVSDSTLEILQASKANGPWKQYIAVFNNWTEFCKLRSWPFSETNIPHCLEYLTYLFKLGRSYSSINTARSCLSSLLPTVGGSQLGQNKLILDFMNGVSRLRPPAPKYLTTWNPDVVLAELSNWETLECNLKILTLKLVGLLALCTGQRVQTLAAIYLSNVKWDNPVQIIITENLKTTTVTNCNPVIKLPPYHENSELCPVIALKQYVKLTSLLRGQEDQLFISFQSPHKRVTSQTISRWLLDVLKLSKIDTSQFTAHSYRHASSSKAARVGVNVDTILKRAGWTPTSKTFAKYYCRPLDTSSEYAVSVLT